MTFYTRALEPNVTKSETRTGSLLPLEDYSTGRRAEMRSLYWTHRGEGEIPEHHDPHAPHAHAIVEHLSSDLRFAVKCHPITRYPSDWRFDETTARREIRAMQACSRAVEHGITPNLPLHFDAYMAPTRCTIRHGVTQLPPLAIYTANEYADGSDLEHWQRFGGQHTPLEWMSCFFQVLAGCAVLNAPPISLCHNDLHWGNVIMQRLPPGGYWHYQSPSQNYYVPNVGQQWRLWDFGFSRPYRDPVSALEDIDNILVGCFQFASRDRAYPHPVLADGWCVCKLERMINKLRQRFLSKKHWNKKNLPNVPMQMLLLLGWFLVEPPPSEILNRGHPYALPWGQMTPE